MNDLQVCTHRPTMKYNCILDQPAVGRSKIPLCKLPPPNFTYGIPSAEREGTVKEALFNWYHQNRKPQKEAKEVDEVIPVDYQKLKYEGIKLNKVPDIVFGDSSGESEDIKAIMCHGYRQMMIENMKNKEAIRRQKIIEKEERLDSRRRVILRINPRKKMTDEQKPLWKLRRFSNVEAKVSTQRNGS